MAARSLKGRRPAAPLLSAAGTTSAAAQPLSSRGQQAGTGVTSETNVSGKNWNADGDSSNTAKGSHQDLTPHSEKVREREKEEEEEEPSVLCLLHSSDRHCSSLVEGL